MMTSIIECNADDYSGANPDIRAEIIRQAERLAQGINDAAQTIDQRGAVMVAVFTPISTAAFAVLTSKAAPALQSFSFGGGLAFALAALLALISILPTKKWEPIAHYPADWADDLRNGISLEQAQGQMLEYYDDALRTNNRLNGWRNKWQLMAMFSVVTAPIIGLICFWLQS